MSPWLLAYTELHFLEASDLIRAVPAADDHSDATVPTSWDMEHENVADAPENAALVQELHYRLVRCAARPDLC